ncbi:LuxR C-terminal-related transcriptional regulator [Frankia sp. AiPs1]|uniref:LuxR C-terminal-related transcriptional regulator n=1 Tax=Frankia sp. AiPs1 TaxID=573493 RepID=UPI0020430BB5|nr:LuxR C-terminal-related transcriptional regulator [Frankia sp. AiPs1]MCM3923453.1 LuxR C-terminal-related transcriptional regulator [Frankia sp. AiPs1]
MFKDELHSGRLGSAVRDVAAGDGTVLSPRAAEILATRLRRTFTPVPTALAARVDRLTRREREVLGLLVVADRSNAEIAGILGVSPTTVKTHMQSLLGKLGVPSRVQAARIARLMAEADLYPNLAS